MASVDADMVKCACPDCVCVVSVEKAVKRDEKAFCCDECADAIPITPAANTPAAAATADFFGRCAG